MPSSGRFTLRPESAHHSCTNLFACSSRASQFQTHAHRFANHAFAVASVLLNLAHFDGIMAATGVACNARGTRSATHAVAFKAKTLNTFLP